MPIHLFWGDDEAARTRAVDALVAAKVDTAWQSINLTRLDGNDASHAAQTLGLGRRKNMQPAEPVRRYQWMLAQ